MQKDVILTPEGLENLKKEIEHLSTVKRREVAERIKEAREFGDISENSEYDDAKNEQMMLEQRIATLEEKLRSASVIDAAELEELTTTKRREVAERIKDAREYGEISENSEYDDAKNEQAMLESRIAALEEKLRSATVVDTSELSNDVVQVGSIVKVKDGQSGKSETYTIVGSAEANPAEKKLSNESPVGRALLGRKAKDKVTVQLPNGKNRELTIQKIEVA